MQQHSLVKEGLPSVSKGEAQKGEGEVHQAIPASERTQPVVTELMEQVGFLGLLNQYQASPPFPRSPSKSGKPAPRSAKIHAAGKSIYRR